MIKKSKKRGQVTLFIILGILIVAVVLIFVFWVRPTYMINRAERMNFEGCVKDAVKNSIKELEKNAGYINPQFSYKHMDEDYVYLCYTEAYYETCVVQNPFLKQHFESELKKQTAQKISECYESSLSELRTKGYSVASGKIDFNISIDLNVVRVLIEAPTTIGTDRFSRFNIEFNSPLYDMLMLATSVLQFEAHYGDTDVDSLNDFYPDYYVEKMKMSDGTTLYTITSKLYENEIKFASRSIAWPPGYYYG